MPNITEASIRESQNAQGYSDDQTPIFGAGLALKSAGSCDDVITSIFLPQACGPDLNATVATLPSFSQYRDFAVQDLYHFCLPVAHDIYIKDETSSVESQTPTCSQEFKGHYTGIVSALAGLGGLALKTSVEMDVHTGHDQAFSWTSEEVCKNDSSVPETIQNSRRLDEAIIAPVETSDSAKLQRLIYLQLRCAAEAGAQLEKDDDNIAGGQSSSKLTTPTDEDNADINVDSGDCCPRGVIPVAFSHGSVGHPDTCAAPCKYFRKKRGCLDGLACSHCHLCDWQSQRTQRGRRRRRSRIVSGLTDGDSENSLDLSMDNMVECAFVSPFQGQAVSN